MVQDAWFSARRSGVRIPYGLLTQRPFAFREGAFSVSAMRLLAVLALPLLVLLAAGAHSRPRGPEFRPGSVEELADLRGASRLKPWRTLQASGYDRGGGFYASGNFLREEPGRTCVMLETEGPGCIDRMWFTRKSTAEKYELLGWLDGDRDPSLRLDLDAFCTGTPPFAAPFAGCVDLARWSYVPIAFRKRCRLALRQTGPPESYATRVNSAGQSIPHVYYQVTYRRLARGARTRPFPPAEGGGSPTAALWRGTVPGLPPGGLEAAAARVTVPPRGEAVLWRTSGAGVIRRLELRAPRDSAGGLRLEATWDGASAPAIDAPLGTFFAAPDPAVDVTGLWVGCRGGAYYCTLPMPFRHGVRLSLRSTGDTPVEVTARVDWSPEAPRPDDAYLHAAAYDHRPPLIPADYPVLDVQGRGHFAGLVMDRPGNMEGDDRFYVDGEAEPSLHGTGTEDFFNFAWGFAHLGDFPLHGITRHRGAPVLYRFHLPAGVPFRRSLRLTFEHGHANQHQGRYSGVAFYYLDRP